MSLPQSISDTSLNDLNAVETDVAVLVEKYIKPINILKSRSKPTPSSSAGKTSSDTLSSIKNDFTNLEVSATQPMESRTSAFYRMLGLPVVGGAGNFYNPGFNSQRGTSLEKQQEINTLFYQNKKDLANQIQLREKKNQTNLSIFGKQDLTSSIYALLLRFPAPFCLINPDITSLAVDNQSVTVKEREDALNILANQNSSLQDNILSVGAPFKTVVKYLKPFVVDPKIETTTIPDTNRIAAPFLKNKQETKIHGENYCLRPGIELILRQRLSPSNLEINAAFLKDVQNIISNTTSSTTSQTSSAERQDILDTLSALSDQNKISTSTQDIFSEFGSIQIKVVLGLIKTIKFLIKRLSENLIIIDKVKKQISWVPVPSTEGPGTGPLGATISRATIKNSSSPLDQSITELRILKLNAESQSSNLADLGDFASPFTANYNLESAKKYTEELDKQTQKRDRLAHSALIAMGEIESITGEVAGLGLVDILAIYLALWSMDLDYLLSFLDNPSFDRLYANNKDFRGNPSVSARQGAGSPLFSMEDSLNALEKKIYNILSWSDTLLTASLHISTSEAGGVENL